MVECSVIASYLYSLKGSRKIYSVRTKTMLDVHYDEDRLGTSRK